MQFVLSALVKHSAKALGGAIATVTAAKVVDHKRKKFAIRKAEIQRLIDEEEQKNSKLFSGYL